MQNHVMGVSCQARSCCMTFLIKIRVDRLTQINQSNKTHQKKNPKNLIKRSNMMGFQIQDDKKLIIEKKSNKKI